MNFYRNGLLTLAFVLTAAVCFSQTYNPNTGSVIWDLGPDDPRVTIQLGTKGINIGGYEDVAPIVKNNFTDTLLVKIQFSITDYCGETKVYTTNAKTLNAWERWAPSPFFEGYGFNTTCKKFGEYGPEKNKTKTRISRISHQIVTLRNMTMERKEAAAEKARKERELALKRQQEEEARRKAAEERKAEEARKLAEREKQEELRKAEEARRKAEAERQQAATQQAREATTSSAHSTSTSGSSTTSGQPTVQQQLAQHAEQQRLAADRRAEEQAAAEAAEREHNRILAEKQLSDMRRREAERRAEEERQLQLEQKRIEHAQKARITQEASEEVEELQSLNLNHSNVEQMEREYAQRLSQLNVAMNNLEQAKQEEWTAAVESKDWGTDQTSQAVGELVHTTGAMFNSIAEDKRRREARENLKWEREQFLRRVENEKAQMRYDLRMEMLENFETWQMPSEPASQPTRIYGFYILHNYPDLSGETTKLTVSNVAEIGTYSDGSWPSSLFFAMVANEAQNYSSRRFHSGYATGSQAEQARQALIQLFSKNGTVTEIHLDANINTPDQRMDFWETGVSGK